MLCDFLPTEDLKLEMPTINLDREVAVLATVSVVVQSLKSCATTWQKLISRVLEEQLEKVPQVMLPVNSKMLLFLETLLHFPTRTVLIFNSSSCLIVGKLFTIS